MALPFDLAGLQAATDKAAWYREYAWEHLKNAVSLRKTDAALADEYRRTAEALFRRADEISVPHPVAVGKVVTDAGELPAAVVDP